MTCIVGLVDGDTVYVGGDSAGVSGADVKIRKDQKVFIIDNRFIIGFTTSFRMGQLLRYSLKPSLQKRSVDDYEYMCTRFIDAVRSCFSKGGFMGKEEEGGREDGGNFLVGYRGVLYEIDEDFQVAINEEPYCSLGCAEDYAHGSLFSTANLGLAPEERIRIALDAAVHFSVGVRPPFNILKLPQKKKR